MIILGIDPGTAATGYGLVKKKKTELELVSFGCIETSARFSVADRLFSIDSQLKKIIKKYKPDKAAVEDIFFFKNLKTAIGVSQARGVILLQIAKSKMPICSYTPLQIKQAVSGYGRASKSQVQRMVKLILGMKEIPQPDDAADALAAAICCANTLKL